MSISPATTQIQNIPAKRMIINEINGEYSSTPGGTIYGTTPGGTRIVYDRSFLMNLKDSPVSRTPPKHGVIPDYLLRGSKTCPPRASPPKSVQAIDEEQFIIEI